MQANLAVGNAPGAAAIEVWGHIELRNCGDAPLQLFEGARVVMVMPGHGVLCGASPSEGVRYVAVEGGVDVPLVLGGRGTLPVARLGGHEGRALRRGDVLPVAEGSGTLGHMNPGPPGFEPGPGGPIRFVPLPEAHAADIEALAAAPFRISPTSDRVGTRLTGRSISSGARGASAPMVRGAIQLPPSGEPIVLGPDHPTTGGYPVLGVVIRADQGRLGARPIGADVQLQPVDLATAREAWTEWCRTFPACE